MFIRVNSIEEVLEKEKKLDHYTRARKVRLLLVEDFNSLRKVYKAIKEKNLRTLRLEEFLESGKSWLGPDDLINVVKTVETNVKPAFLFSADNLLRLYRDEDLKSTLTSIMNQKTREPFPLFLVLAGLKERLHLIFESTYLSNFKEYFYELEKEQESYPVHVLSVNPKLNIGKGDFIRSFKDYLGLWEVEGNVFKVGIRSVHARIKNAEPDTAVNFKRIESLKDYITTVLKFGEKIHIEDEEYDRELIKRGIRSLEEVVGVYEDFDEWLEDLFEIPPSDKFKLYSYLNYGINRFREFAELIKERDRVNIAFNVYTSDILPKEKREKILEKLLKKHPYLEEELCENFKNLNKKPVLALMSCEKESLISDFKEGKIKKEDLEKYKDFRYYLETPYPSNAKEEHEKIIEYFDAYKEAKLLDRITPRLSTLEEDLNGNEDKFFKWYYSLEPVLELVDKLREKVEKVLFVDALGFEWAGFIKNHLEEKGISVNALYLARAELPSITEKNYQKDVADVEYRDFDRLIHEETYRHPYTFVKELKKLKEILDRMPEGRGFLIFGDHGSSALVRLVEGLELEGNFGHSGRYSTEEINHPEVVNYSEVVWVARSRRSLGKKPTREVHGGALPEEVITFVLLANIHSEKNYKLHLLTKKVSRRKGVVEFRISPTPSQLPVVKVDGKFVKCKVQGNKFTIEEKKAGKHKIEVFIEDQVLEGEFWIEGGISTREELL